MSTLKQAFEMVRDALNTALVPTDFPNPLSTTPKHPDYVEKDDAFPYFCMMYAGETPSYDQSDTWWITPSMELADLTLWLAIAPSETDSLSADLMAIVRKVRTTVKAITLDRVNCDFRVRVSAVETQYEPSGRWALATVTVTVGAYDT